MRNKIIITRPSASAKIFARDLCAEIPMLSMEDIMYAPMFQIAPHPFDAVPDHYDVLVSTSSNALEYIPDHFRGLPIYCVGSQSATKAKEIGFSDVRGGCETISDLMDIVVQDSTGRALTFCYFRGQYVSFDVKSFLDESGQSVDEYICYSAAECEVLPEDLIRAIKGGEVKAITFFSKRTAQVFMQHIRSGDLLEDMAQIRALCISEGVLECLDDIFEEGIVSKVPTMNGIIDAVRAITAE